MQMAAGMARSFAASHLRINVDDLIQIAHMAIIRGVDTYRQNEKFTLFDHVASEINRYLLNEAQKDDRDHGKATPKKFKARPLTISLQVVGTTDGPSFNSILDLRMARSLNPRPDCDMLTIEAIGEVRQAAILQNSPYVQPEQGAYLAESEMNRKRVSDIRARMKSIKQQRRDRAAAMPDEMPQAA